MPLLILLLIPLTACLPRTDDILPEELHLMEPGLTPLAGGAIAGSDSLLPMMPSIPGTAGGAASAAGSDLRAWEQEEGEWY